MAAETNPLQLQIDKVKGIGPAWGSVLMRELSLFTVADMLSYFPFRYEDRTRIHMVHELVPDMPPVQVAGTIGDIEYKGDGPRRRLVAQLWDGNTHLELVFFNGAKWVERQLRSARRFIAYGKAEEYYGKFNMVHPELQVYSEEALQNAGLFPVYNTTDVMKQRRLESRALAKIMRGIVDTYASEVHETLPDWMRTQEGLLLKKDAIKQIHFPENEALAQSARHRLKFEELLTIQVKMLEQKQKVKVQSHGLICSKSDLVKRFTAEALPYELTGAQRRVIKEIWGDLQSGKQMNRLLQGDVGSGKTVVAFISMLLAASNGYQACMMAPTEILADQHYQSLLPLCEALQLPIAKLTGSVPKKERVPILEALASGKLPFLVGTHALIEEAVEFNQLALAVIDEQHRFGVDQRAKLRNKGKGAEPHVLVMTATPIPRTLALTLYGDLDVSIIDELPVGRKSIRTVHRFERDRDKVLEFIRAEVSQGRQAYIVYPLVEESEKLDLQNVTEGFEQAKHHFSDYNVVMVHGRMKWPEREGQMQQFVRNEAQIMVATTVIEVGVNVPNASIMLIENAERFGLAQLHQLRGRVGRGAQQSYCILLTSNALSAESRKRLKTMVETTDGFVISEVDMELRGMGDMLGRQQSGQTRLSIANLTTDQPIVLKSRDVAEKLLERRQNLPKEDELFWDYLHEVIKSPVNYLQIA